MLNRSMTLLPILLDAGQWPNPHEPLSFERFGGSGPATKDGGWANPVSMERDCLQLDPQHAAAYRNRDTYTATLLALEAAELPARQAVAAAQRALRLSPACAEAHNVLARFAAASFEEALEEYRTAERLGREVGLAGQFERELVAAAGNLWARLHLRPWMRALFGCGNTLRKMARYAAALECYERLLLYQTELVSELAYHTHLPELWYRVHGPAQALELVQRLPSPGKCANERYSSSTHWLYTLALAHFATGRVAGYPQEAPPTPRDFWKNAWGGSAVLYALNVNPSVAELLLGWAPMPGGPIPAVVGDHMESEAAMDAQAATYVHACRDLWESQPAALGALRRVANTVNLSCHLQAVLQGQAEFSPATVAAALADGCDVAGHVWELDQRRVLLSQLCYQGHHPEVPRLVALMLESGAGVAARDSNDLTPLHHAAYTAADPEVIRLLVEAGADPLADSAKPHLSPLGMAANQGNFAVLDAILTARPSLRTEVVLRRLPGGAQERMGLLPSLMLELLCTSILSCVAGGSRCPRCAAAGGPPPEMAHPPDRVSCKRAASVLVRHGLRFDGQLREISQRLLRSDLPASVMQPMRDLVEQLAKESQEAGPLSSSSAAGGGGGGGGRGPAAHQQQAAAAACWKCGAGGKLQHCSRCGVAQYCGAECQRAHWKAHKQACKPKAG